MDIPRLVEQLERHEGIAQFPYHDTVGKLTIGVGRNLTDKGISKREAHVLMRDDVQDCIDDLDHHLPWWRTLSDQRQNVLINMCFNMGIMGLIGFQQMLNAAKLGDYDKASQEMLRSLWANQVGIRAIELSKQMKDGVWEVS